MPDFTMQYRRLGASNLNVSALCLGTMMFGDQTDEAEAGRIVASARSVVPPFEVTRSRSTLTGSLLSAASFAAPSRGCRITSTSA